MKRKIRSNNSLGLPAEYQHMPQYFDAHNVCEETDKKNAAIEQLLKAQHVKTVLDMTCGTGSQVFYLTKLGYQVTGSDFSPPLLKQARQKAKAQNRDLTFIDGDMRNLQLGQFDAVITMFNAIGHMSKADFGSALQNIYNNLKPGGIYLFDIFNLKAITDEVIAGFDMDITTIVAETKIRKRQYSELDIKNRLLTSYDHYAIFKQETTPEIYTNHFSLQLYEADELTEMLTQNGFKDIQHYDLYGNKFVANHSQNIVTMAKKHKLRD